MYAPHGSAAVKNAPPPESFSAGKDAFGNVLAHRVESRVDFVIGKAQYLAAVRPQDGITLGVIGFAVRGVVLRAVNLYDELRGGTVEVDDEMVDDGLPPKLDREGPQKVVPQVVFLRCGVFA